MKKNKLTVSQTKHIAQLAGLNLTLKEVKKFQNQLSEILAYFKILQKVATEKVEPTSQVTGLENVLRKDEIKTSLFQKQALLGSLTKKDGYFVAKSIIEKWS